MKRLNSYVCAALAIAAAVACEPLGNDDPQGNDELQGNDGPTVVDYPIVGDFALYGAASADAAWPADTKIGVCVTSDGVTQSNLEYSPSSTELAGAVELTAAATKAGFKQGDHVIYAYYPYSANVSGTAVSLGDLSVQATTKEVPQWVYDAAMDDMADMFAEFVSAVKPLNVAKAEVNEYTSAPIDLGVFAPVEYLTIAVAEPGLSGETVGEGETVQKIVVKSNKVIAYTDAQYDLSNSTLSGNNGVQAIEIAAAMVLKSMGSVTGNPFSFTTCLTSEDLADATFTIEFHFDGGIKYVSEELTPNSSNMLINVVLNEVAE